eukprot:Pgem_evm2s106
MQFTTLSILSSLIAAAAGASVPNATPTTISTDVNPAPNSIMLCSQEFFTGKCHFYSKADGKFSWNGPFNRHLSLKVGSKVRLHVLNKWDMHFLPVSGPTGNGQFSKLETNNIFPETANPQMQVMDFSDLDTFVSFPEVRTVGGICALADITFKGDGLFQIPSNRDHFAIPDTTATTDLIKQVDGRNMMFVSSGTTVQIFGEKNFKGASATVVGPQLLCLEQPVNGNSFTNGPKIGSLLMVPTWRSDVMARWKLIGSVGGGELSRSLSIGYQWSSSESSSDSFQ